MAEPRTWILTGSPENLAATAQRDFALIGLKERRRRQAEHIEPGDRIVFYVTGAMAFAGSVRGAKRTPVAVGPAFQGQIRPVGEHDAALLMERLRAAAGVAA